MRKITQRSISRHIHQNKKVEVARLSTWKIPVRPFGRAAVPEGSSRALPVISTRGCGAGQDDVRRAEELRSTLSAELLSSSGVEGNPRKPLATCGPTR